MFAITENHVSTIQRASRWLLGLFIFLALILAWGTVNRIVHPFPPGTRTLAGVVFEGAEITGKIQVLWLLQILLGAALNLKIFYHLSRLMMAFSKGLLFTAQNVSQIRQIALTSIASLAVWLVVLIGAAPEIAAAQDQWVKIMGTFPGGMLMTAIVFLFATRLMSEGRQLREEQDLVI